MLSSVIRITVTGRLGSGSYAKVYEAVLDDGMRRRPVAVKKMNPAKFQDEQDVLDFFRETELLASARTAGHPNILAFIGVRRSHFPPVTSSKRLGC